MNTKQLTVLWYGTIAASAVLLWSGRELPTVFAPFRVVFYLAALALVTATLIYTVGPRPRAHRGRVALAVAIGAGVATLVLVNVETIQVRVVTAMREWRARVPPRHLALTNASLEVTPCVPGERFERLDRIVDELVPDEICPRAYFVGTVSSESGRTVRRVTVEAVLEDSSPDTVVRRLDLETRLEEGDSVRVRERLADLPEGVKLRAARVVAVSTQAPP